MASFLTEWRPLSTSSLFARPPLWDEMVRDFFGPQGDAPQAQAPRFSPRASVHETAEAYVVRVDLPGIRPEDVDVSLTGDTLTIQGERKQEAEKAGEQWHLAEQSWGSFQRSFAFASPVESDGVQAESQDGVLEVRVTKAKEAQPRKIEIKSKKTQ
jgi:HSP20 family protein